MAFAAPALLCGGTPKTGQGCTLLPPIPVEEPCRDWHIGLPDLDSDPSLQSSQGNGVTVFILDAFPERGVMSRAAQDAGIKVFNTYIPATVRFMESPRYKMPLVIEQPNHEGSKAYMTVVEKIING